MGLFTTRRLIFIITLLLIPTIIYGAAIKGLEESVDVGYCKQIDFQGGNITLSTTGLNCVLTESGLIVSTSDSNNTEVLFNDGGTNIKGDADFTWNKTTNTLTVGGADERWTGTTYGEFIDFNDLGDGYIYMGADVVTSAINHVVVVDGITYAATDVGIEAAIAALPANGGTVYLPAGTYTLTDSVNVASNVRLVGAGWGTILNNTAVDGSPAIEWDGATDNRLSGFGIEKVKIVGNASSGDGVYIQWTEDDGDGNNWIRDCWITGHGSDGIYWEEGDQLVIEGNLITSNAGRGIYIYSTTNMAIIQGNSISGNTLDGIYVNQVASNTQIQFNSIHDNGDTGIYAYRAEAPQIQFNSLNRNGGAGDAGIKVVGQTDKYCEGALIMGNLLGDNGSGTEGSEADYELSLYYAYATQIIGNYFYGVDQAAFIRLADFTQGTNISNNRFKSISELGTGVLSVGTPSGAGTLTYSFQDNKDETSQEYDWTLYDKNFNMSASSFSFDGGDIVFDTTVNGLFYDDSTDRVGIGTSEPSNQLDVYSSSATPLEIQRSAAGNCNIKYTNTSSSMYAGIGLNNHFYIGTGADLANNDVAVFQTDGKVGIGTTTPVGIFTADGGDVIFDTTVNGVFYDDSTDRVGIGTSTPSALLNVDGGDVRFFDGDDVGDTTDGNSFYVYRKAAEGDSYIRMNVDQTKTTIIRSDTSMKIRVDSGTLYLEPPDTGTVLVGRAWDSGQNGYFGITGYITAVTAARYVKFQVSDATDNFELTRQDANIGAFDVQMPMIMSGASVTFDGTDTALILSQPTADPCGVGGFVEGALFWNPTAHELCVCDGSNDVRVKDASTACY